MKDAFYLELDGKSIHLVQVVSRGARNSRVIHPTDGEGLIPSPRLFKSFEEAEEMAKRIQHNYLSYQIKLSKDSAFPPLQVSFLVDLKDYDRVKSVMDNYGFPLLKTRPHDTEYQEVETEIHCSRDGLKVILEHEVEGLVPIVYLKR